MKLGFRTHIYFEEEFLPELKFFKKMLESDPELNDIKARDPRKMPTEKQRFSTWIKMRILDYNISRKKEALGKNEGSPAQNPQIHAEA